MVSPKVFYSSSQMQWSSSPEDGKVHGTRNSVTIRNGKGFKVKESLNAKGKILQRKKQTLKKKEIQNILHGDFMPGFWKNCALGNCAVRRNKTRKNA